MRPPRVILLARRVSYICRFRAQVMQASKMSMGMDVSDMDMANINMFLERVIELSEYRMRLHEYLVNKMDKVSNGTAPPLHQYI